MDIGDVLSVIILCWTHEPQKFKLTHSGWGKQNGRYFARDISKVIFLYDNVCILIHIFTEICPQGSNWKQASFGSANGLAPSRRQDIISTNDGLISLTHICVTRHRVIFSKKKYSLYSCAFVIIGVYIRHYMLLCSNYKIVYLHIYWPQNVTFGL